LVTDTTFGKLSFPTKRSKKPKILNKIFTHDKTHFIDCVVVITVCKHSKLRGPRIVNGNVSPGTLMASRELRKKSLCEA
jgi:hypothetical protein